jgi:hypothetical protein
LKRPGVGAPVRQRIARGMAQHVRMHLEGHLGRDPGADQDHGTVSGAVAVALGGLDQLPDLALGQVFARPKFAVWATGRRMETGLPINAH